MWFGFRTEYFNLEAMRWLHTGALGIARLSGRIR
jgi:hypothetical protein